MYKSFYDVQTSNNRPRPVRSNQRERAHVPIDMLPRLFEEQRAPADAIQLFERPEHAIRNRYDAVCGIHLPNQVDLRSETEKDMAERHHRRLQRNGVYEYEAPPAPVLTQVPEHVDKQMKHILTQMHEKSIPLTREHFASILEGNREKISKSEMQWLLQAFDIYAEKHKQDSSPSQPPSATPTQTPSATPTAMQSEGSA